MITGINGREGHERHERQRLQYLIDRIFCESYAVGYVRGFAREYLAQARSQGREVDRTHLRCEVALDLLEQGFPLSKYLWKTIREQVLDG